MKTHRVVFSRRADRQLQKLHRYLLKKAGERIAAAYLDRLIAFCFDLAIAPHRGNLRPELGEGIRAVGFENTVGVQFRVRNEIVQILNIAYRGQQYERHFNG